MNKPLMWFWFSMKRELKRIWFAAALLLFPFLLWLSDGAARADDGMLDVALYAGEQADGLTRRIVERLVEEEDAAGEEPEDAAQKESDGFRFYLCPDLETLQEDVETRRAECGYVFPDDLEEMLDSGQWKRSIILYRAPSTVADALSSEVVFAALMEEYGKEILMDFMTSDQLFAELDQELVRRETEELWEKYRSGGSTFSFVYETAQGEAADAKGTAALPARGLAAVWLFMAGLFAAVTVSQDERRGLFVSLPAGQRGVCRVAVMAGPAALAALSGLLGLAAAGILEPLWYEAAAMGIYLAAVVAFSAVLQRLIPHPAAICSLIPVFLLGSLFLCPVFFDAGRLVPRLETLGRLFLPFYYLKAF